MPMRCQYNPSPPTEVPEYFFCVLWNQARGVTLFSYLMRKGLIMKNTVKIASLGALGALATLLAACNTVDGVGKDVEAGGEVIQDTSQDVEDEIND